MKRVFTLCLIALVLLIAAGRPLGRCRVGDRAGPVWANPSSPDRSPPLHRRGTGAPQPNRLTGRTSRALSLVSGVPNDDLREEI